MSMGAANGLLSVLSSRSVNIALRTAHVGFMALLFGGRHFSVELASLRPWHALTALTGAALLANEASHSRHWVYQGRGVLVLAHVAAVALVVAAPGMAVPAIAAALIIGCIGSHLPGAIRKWSFRHRRVVD
jgi:hypothetical protein